MKTKPNSYLSDIFAALAEYRLYLEDLMKKDPAIQAAYNSYKKVNPNLPKLKRAFSHEAADKLPEKDRALIKKLVMTEELLQFRAAGTLTNEFTSQYKLYRDALATQRDPMVIKLLARVDYLISLITFGAKTNVASSLFTSAGGKLVNKVDASLGLPPSKAPAEIEAEETFKYPSGKPFAPNQLMTQATASRFTTKTAVEEENPLQFLTARLPSPGRSE